MTIRRRAVTGSWELCRHGGSLPPGLSLRPDATGSIDDIERVNLRGKAANGIQVKDGLRSRRSKRWHITTGDGDEFQWRQGIGNAYRTLLANGSVLAIERPTGHHRGQAYFSTTRPPLTEN